ncbi:cleavage stimulation factor subunit 2 tau variant-like [Anopheles bellator]|uniref:cleavage stimulation factor subunit 2 tau variant-like n=1 Tax=Anopheles bellator TaxID=139047 RepID=UPI002647652E|nr:cleavage stimulation factor subunit 2 tau variant-like [Anopheles bellator]
MGDRNHDPGIMDKSLRSVFVGNIPYDATEEALKEIFCEVGLVLSMKLVYDRESGKPKGYGFCEYKDKETALSAMRNLNGYVFGGRPLRVDNACTEKSRMEMAALLHGPRAESPYGDHCPPQHAPEIITKHVSSLPPERLHEMMLQMKQLIQTSPFDARHMLMQNPQLAYALLQIQVLTKAIDPVAAYSLLAKAQSSTSANNFGEPFHPGQPTMPNSNSQYMPPFGANGNPEFRPNVDPRLGRQQAAANANDYDPRTRFASGTMGGQSAQRPQPMPQNAPFPTDPRQRPVDPRMGKDPRLAAAPGGHFGANVTAAQAAGAVMGRVGQPPSAASLSAASSGLNLDPLPSDATDQEKAALIMQVLQLSDEQINLLPPEQRNSILVLKEQIVRSTQIR